MKSYKPLFPRGRSKKPAWIDDSDTQFVTGVVTDDTEFGGGYLKPLSSTTYAYANKRRDKWFYLEIDRARVKVVFKPRAYPA